MGRGGDDDSTTAPRLLQLATVGHDDRLLRAAALGAYCLNRLHDLHALGHVTENDVLAVQPRRLDGAEEELGSVRVRAGVGHGQNAAAGVLQCEVLIGELLSIDALAAGAVAAREVTALAHEVGDDTVESRSLVTETLLASAQSTEVLGGARHDVGTESHLDASGRVAANGDVKKNNWV